MLIPDQYVHSRSLYVLARKFIYQRLVEFSNEQPLEDIKSAELRYRARIAAAQLCEFSHMKHGPEGLYRAFRPGTEPIPMDRLVYERRTASKFEPPRFFFEYVTSRNGGTKATYRTWAETIEADFWVKSILSWVIPEDEEGDTGRVSLLGLIHQTPLVNLESGAIDLDDLRASIRTTETGAEFNLAIQKQGLRVPGGLSRFLENSGALCEELRSVLRAIEPFESFPLVIRQSHFSKILEFLMGSKEASSEEMGEEEDPVEEILKIKRSNPTLAKMDTYTALGGQGRMAIRKFLMYWAMAAEIDPELSKAGRKPRNRNG